MTKPSSNYHFPIVSNTSIWEVSKGFLQAGWTVVFVPKHDTSLSLDAARARQTPQPLQPAVESEVLATKRILDTDARRAQRVFLPTTKDILGLAGVIMQFSSYLPSLHEYIETPYEHIDRLHQAIVKAGKAAPLTFSQQLSISLYQTDGDILEAVWRLFLMSRLNARWYDERILIDVPSFTRQQKIQRMTEFTNAVAACKAHAPHSSQDIAGDTYYCWTHVLGTIIFNSPNKQNKKLLRHIFTTAIRNGTRLNHAIAHKVTPQALKSDHTIAARYGNAIGSVCSEITNSSFSDSATNTRKSGAS